MSRIAAKKNPERAAERYRQNDPRGRQPQGGGAAPSR